MAPDRSGVDQTPTRVNTGFNPWNLLLFVPLLSLVTPLFNTIEPRVFGMPVLYWSQLAFIVLGVLCTLVVHRMVGREPRGRGRG